MKEYLFIFCIFLIFFDVQISKSEENSIILTVLYDNYKFIEDTEADWGFACLIEGTQKTILFDTGTKPDILLRNVEKLNKELRKVDIVVISHNHGDHTGGLDTLLSINPNVTVYFPVSFPDKFEQNIKKKKAITRRISEPLEICKNVYSTGEMGDNIKEQSLILDTQEGIVIITGCSHPGILSILEKAQKIIDNPIYLVFGGFHLLRHTNKEVMNVINEFKSKGVKKCGPTHCTGENMIELFKNAYKDNYIPMGVGKGVQIGQKTD